MKVLSIFLLIISSVFSQQQQQQPIPFFADEVAFAGYGARAKGMGNAFTAVADDATAIAWNPAGLTNLYGTELSITGRYRTGSIEYDVSGLEGFDTFDASEKGAMKLDFASLVLPAKFEFATFVFGGAYRSLYDWDTERTVTWEKQAFNKFSAEHVYTREGGVHAWTLSAGMSLLDFVAAGISFNKIGGTINEFSTNKQMRDGITTSEQKSNTFEHSYSGQFLDVGALVKFGDVLNFGFKASLPYEISAETDIKELTLDKKPEFHRDVPRLISLGAAIRFSDTSLLSADLRFQKWEDVRISTTSGERFFNEINLNSFHIGYESLSLNTETNSSSAWRLGFFTKPQLSFDLEEDKIISYGVITAGYGITNDIFSLDFSAQWEIQEDKQKFRDLNSNEVIVPVKGNIFHLNATFIFYLSN